MKRSLHPYFLLATFVLTTVLASAQSTNPLFQHLPPDADKIYHINLPAITSKVSWEELTSVYSMTQKASDPQLMELLKDPSTAGLDIHQDVFVAQNIRNPYDSGTQTTILFHLTDSAKFISLIRSKSKNLKTFHIAGKVRVAGIDMVACSWNDKLAVITIVTKPAKVVAAAVSQGKKAITPVSTAFYTLAAAKKSVAALQGYVNSPYTTDPEFLAGFSDDADVHTWSAQGAGIAMVINMIIKKKDPNMTKAFSKMQQSKVHTLTAFRFETGKLTMHTTANLPADSLALLQKLNTRPFNPDLVNRIPGSNLLGMLNIHFDPTAITDILNKYKMRAKADSSLSAKGLSTNDVTKAFKGDFVLAGVAPSPASNDSAGGSSSKQPAIYFIATINDLGAFMKVANKLNLAKPSSPDSPSTGGFLGKLKSDYTLRDNILVVSANKQLTDGYFDNPNRKNTALISDPVRDNPFSLAIDVKAVAA